MKLFSSKKRVAAIGALTAATLLGGGMAYGYWTTTGTGSGTATTGTVTAWSVDVTDSSAGNLSPTSIAGLPVQTVNYAIENVGTGQQQLAEAAISVASVTPGPVSGPNACAAGDFSISGELAGDTYTETIATNQAPGAIYNGTVELRLIDNNANQDRCQGATVTLTVDAS